MPTEKTKLALLIQRVNDTVEDAKQFVTKLEFNSRVGPLEKIVYGLVTMILVAFMGALIALIIR